MNTVNAAAEMSNRVCLKLHSGCAGASRHCLLQILIDRPSAEKCSRIRQDGASTFACLDARFQRRHFFHFRWADVQESANR